jgi:hypothetical protein
MCSSQWKGEHAVGHRRQAVGNTDGHLGQANQGHMAHDTQLPPRPLQGHTQVSSGGCFFSGRFSPTLDLHLETYPTMVHCSLYLFPKCSEQYLCPGRQRREKVSGRGGTRASWASHPLTSVLSFTFTASQIFCAHIFSAISLHVSQTTEPACSRTASQAAKPQVTPNVYHRSRTTGLKFQPHHS